MSETRHEWAAVEARNTRELAEVLDRLDGEGYTLNRVLATPLSERGAPSTVVLYTVIAVRERPIPLPPAPDVESEAKAR